MKNLKYHHCRFMGLFVLVCFFSAGLLSPIKLAAHGVEWSLSQKKSYGLEFYFDDGTPMAFADVKVYRPGETENMSQTGRTDKNGYFAFIPDADGEWTVKADDGTGHLAQAQVAVASHDPGEATAPQAEMIDLEKIASQATKPLKIALVVSIFLNLAALAAFMKRKK